MRAKKEKTEKIIEKCSELQLKKRKKTPENGFVLREIGGAAWGNLCRYIREERTT